MAVVSLLDPMPLPHHHQHWFFLSSRIKIKSGATKHQAYEHANYVIHT